MSRVPERTQRAFGAGGRSQRPLDRRWMLERVHGIRVHGMVERSSEAVTTWYLEMRERRALTGAPPPREQLAISEALRPTAAFARFLYTSVGGMWHWTDRLAWPKERWDAWLARSEVHLWTLYVGGVPAGYVELEQQPQGNVEIAYFGVAPEFMGRGFGGHLLTFGCERAWDLAGTQRLWVHTCTRDAPAALANYRARGFRLYDEKVHCVPLGAVPGPWMARGPRHRAVASALRSRGRA